MKNWLKGGIIGLIIGILLIILSFLFQNLILIFLALGSVFCNILFKCEAGFFGFGGTGFMGAIIAGGLLILILLLVVGLIIGLVIDIIKKRGKTRISNPRESLINFYPLEILIYALYGLWAMQSHHILNQ
ncbi:hypothetical protein COU56_04385 [Candidatus Pacearchaeota archaeon CG10_big_fil_rev_8_21_14_0_10_31_9]|nr:MAG: hypothetical protein COU56_04385 [Candidatus Pacearchaeota archaeon CG10_big_fil_rev_8_21_14_0_10_31_9]PIZ82535.1 MAG: hypothetical protein COX97_04315 [Candidatus Pacearchaeota archaeon CG_4_10_14_0_2_um_filter_05_32_18]